MSAFKASDIKKHRPTDPTDPGFSIVGYKLRWLNGAHQEAVPGRIWIPLKKSDLPQEVVSDLRNKYHSMMGDDGDVIRRGNSILGYASMDAVAGHKKHLRNLAHEDFKSEVELPQDAKVENKRQQMAISSAKDFLE